MTVELNKIYQGDALAVLRELPAEYVDCIVTSPPYYGLRNYGVDGQIGLENTPEGYIERLTAVFMECHRVLKREGTMWVVIGDSYAGSGRGIGDVNKKGVQPKASFV
jgi:DNA modification methylase